MKKRILLHLEGGLGNQLFQFANAINLSKKLKAELVIDKSLGIFLSSKVKNFKMTRGKFELPIKKKYKNPNLLDYFIVVLFRIIRKFFFLKEIVVFNNWIFINDKKNKKFLKIPNFKKFNTIFLIGWFQSEKYFKQNKFSIYNKLKLNVNNLKKKINIEKSIFLGVRLYEETSNPKWHISNKNFYRRNINYFKKKIKNPVFYIFSTAKKPILKKILGDNFNAIYVKKFKKNDPINTLSLMLNFNKFMLSNSTFYWWGAYLSSLKNKNIKVICSKNNQNRDFIPKWWSAN